MFKLNEFSPEDELLWCLASPNIHVPLQIQARPAGNKILIIIAGPNASIAGISTILVYFNGNVVGSLERKNSFQLVDTPLLENDIIT